MTKISIGTYYWTDSVFCETHLPNISGSCLMRLRLVHYWAASAAIVDPSLSSWWNRFNPHSHHTHTCTTHVHTHHTYENIHQPRRGPEKWQWKRHACTIHPRICQECLCMRECIACNFSRASAWTCCDQQVPFNERAREKERERERETPMSSHPTSSEKKLWHRNWHVYLSCQTTLASRSNVFWHSHRTCIVQNIHR